MARKTTRGAWFASSASCQRGSHNTSDRRVSGPENQVPVLGSKGRCRAILKNRETRLSSRRRPYDCQHLLAPYCSSRPDETLSWAASSRFRAARQARYVRSKGDQPHCPYCLATLSFPSTTHLAFEGRPHREMRVLSALTKTRSCDSQYTAIAPSLKNGPRTCRMALATSRSSAGTGPVAACE